MTINGHFFLYNLYIFVWIHFLVSVFNPSFIQNCGIMNCVMKRLLSICLEYASISLAALCTSLFAFHFACSSLSFILYFDVAFVQHTFCLHRKNFDDSNTNDSFTMVDSN